MSQALEDSADVIDKLIGQLESVLHDPETDPNKRKMAEFKLPDSNNDDMISRQEVRSTFRKREFCTMLSLLSSLLSISVQRLSALVLRGAPGAGGCRIPDLR